jgi:hypothetical protein
MKLNFQKCLFFFCLITAAYTPLQAQQKNYRVNFGLFGNFPERYFNPNISKYNGKNAGLGIHLHPQKIINTKHSIGVNLEYALVQENFQTDAIDVYNIVSISPTYHYFIGKKAFKPFVGGGIGLAHVAYNKPDLNMSIRPIIGITYKNYVNMSLEFTKLALKVRYNPRIIGPFDDYYFCFKTSISIGVK